MSRQGELQVVERALQTYATALYANDGPVGIEYLLDQIACMLNEFMVSIQEFTKIVKKVGEKNKGFPAVILLEVLFPKVPIVRARRIF